MNYPPTSREKWIIKQLRAGAKIVSKYNHPDYARRGHRMKHRYYLINTIDNKQTEAITESLLERMEERRLIDYVPGGWGIGDNAP